MTELIKDKLYAIVVPEDAKLIFEIESVFIYTTEYGEKIKPGFEFDYWGFLTAKDSSFNVLQLTKGKYDLR